MVDDSALRLHRIAQYYDEACAAWKNADFSPKQKEFLMAQGRWIREIARLLRKEEGEAAVFE
jgi:hypothetical protein